MTEKKSSERNQKTTPSPQSAVGPAAPKLGGPEQGMLLEQTSVQRARMARPLLSPRNVRQLQRAIGNRGVGQMMAQGTQPEAQPKTTPSTKNSGGMPTELRSGVEALSGVSLEGIQVHYNSPKPQQLQALAYTQGTDIHVGPGQEKQLPHEAWHVVQQKQGKVRPTTQLQGVEINDDAALEREADVMGARASQMTATPAETAQKKLVNAAPSEGVAQLQHETTASEKSFKLLKTLSSSYGKGSLDWRPKSKNIYQYITTIKKVLEEEADQKDLKKLENEIDTLVFLLDVTTNDLIAAPPYREERPLRNPKKRRYEKDSESTNKRRKTSKTKSKKETSLGKTPTQHELLVGIKAYMIDLGKKVRQLKQQYPLHEGGFSAKGRAHKMGESQKTKIGSQAVTTWFKNITLDGEALDKRLKVYKPNPKVSSEKASKPSIPKKFRPSKNNKKARGEALAKLEEKLTPLALRQTPPDLQGPPVSANRNGGQTKNMKGASATGYAALAGLPNWQAARWEWLHVRAASLGGKTDGSNLVAGVRDANTQMMPFEANIRLLAKIAGENPNFKGLKVTYSVTGQDSKAKHKVTKIKIAWELIKSSTGKKAKGAKGEANFNPLLTNANISKTEAGMLEKVLKEKREESVKVSKDKKGSGKMDIC